MSRVAILFALLLSTSCAADFASSDFASSDSAPAEGQDTCGEASLDVQACLDSAKSGDTAPADCQPLIEDAASLCSAAKADGWGLSLCSMGVLHYCEVPVCDVPSVSDGGECAEYLDEEGCASCDYYLCKEAAEGDSACGEEGYYLGYGFKYCERMSLITRTELSGPGKVWLDGARLCLIEEVERQIDDEHSCSDIKQIAFDSHPGCYIDSGFCSLPWGDMWSVFISVDPTDVEVQQVLLTGVSCFRDFF